MTSSEAWKTSCRRRQARSRWRATLRSGRTCTRRCPPSSPTGGTSRSRGCETRALFDQSHHMTGSPGRGPGHHQRCSPTIGVNSFENFEVEQGEAVRRRQPRRVRHRRRHPLLPRAELRPARRAAVGPQLAPVPRRDRRLRRRAVAGRAHRGEPERAARALPVPGAGPDRARRPEEGERRLAAGDQVLQHGRAHDRRPQGARAAPRDVGRARDRALRAMGGARGRARRDHRGGEGLRAPARSARASTRRTRSSPAGSRARSRPCSPATR